MDFFLYGLLMRITLTDLLQHPVVSPLAHMELCKVGLSVDLVVVSHLKGQVEGSAVNQPEIDMS